MNNSLRVYCTRRSLLMLCGDLSCFLISFVLALLIRFDFSNYMDFKAHLPYGPIIIALQFVAYISSGLYVAMWRYTSVKSIVHLCCAAGLAFLVGLFTLYFFWPAGFSRGLLVIDMLLVILSTSGLRVGVRLYHEYRYKRSTRSINSPDNTGRVRRIIILGGGSAGELIIRELLKSSRKKEIPVAILDDDQAKQGRTIHGVPIVGPIEALPTAVVEYDTEEVFICIPSAKGRHMRRIVGICEQSGLKYKTLPGVNELINGNLGLRTLREVSYDDLLGREPVTLDLERIHGYLTDKVVLVTGCGGSIGSELCRKILPFAPRRILLLDSGEFNLFTIASELSTFHNTTCGVPLLANLTDAALLDRIFTTYRPDVVFHAAAYKHVPLLEINPWQAIYNNIIASQNLIETSLRHRVGTFVLVSTDKAVRPTNVMGVSKRITELLLQNAMNSSMRCMAVRFGNVIGSSGSVVPFFLKQIKAGRPVTVTHPEVTRYFMTIGEAAQLIIQAGGMGQGGETFLIKMGHSVRIRDMAADLIRLCGMEPETDVPIVYTGLRDGEKLYEELITDGENVVQTGHDKLMQLRADNSALSQEERAARGRALADNIEELRRLADAHDQAGIKRVLREIVPEYMPQPVDHSVLQF